MQSAVLVQMLVREEFPNLGSGQNVLFQSYTVVVHVGLKISMGYVNVSNKLQVTAEKSQSYIGFGLERRRFLTLKARFRKNYRTSVFERLKNIIFLIIFRIFLAMENDI